MSKQKQKTSGKSTAKGVAISAGAGIVGGAASGGVAYALDGKRVETQEIPITWQNLNEDALFKAISKKWQPSAGDADLSTHEGWLQMIDYFKSRGNDALAQNAWNDLCDVREMSQKGLSFEGFTTKEDLADYISGQDVTETVRTSVAEQAKAAFEAKWGFSYDAKFGIFPKKIAEMNNPSKTQELLEDRYMVRKWNNDTLTSEANVDAFLTGKGYDVSNMTIQEKIDTIFSLPGQAHSTTFNNGYTPEALTNSFTKGEMTDIRAIGAQETLDEYDRHMELVYMRDNVAVDVSDLKQTFGTNSVFDSANTEITNNRQDMIEGAIEKKYNLEDGSVDLDTPSSDVLNQVDPDSKSAMVDNIVNAGAYIRDQKLPIPDNAADMVDRVSVRDVVENMIANGDTTTVEHTVGSLDLSAISGISGLGCVVSFGIMFTIWKLRVRKLNKTFAAAQAQVDELEAKMDAADENENAPVLQQKKGLFGRRK